MPSFIVSAHQGGFSIEEGHNSPNALKVKSGEISAIQMQAIAYKILSMVESDKVI